MKERITNENVFKVDIAELALDNRFGSLVFGNANKKLSKAQQFLKEMYDLGYEDIFNENDVKYVKNNTIKLAEHLEWLRNFDISSVPNPKQEHDNFEGRVDAFYNDIYIQVLMRMLPVLRDERRRENPNQQKIDEELKKTVQIRTDLEKELETIKEETKKIRTTGKDVSSEKGKRAAVRMSLHFNNEVERYERLAKIWLVATIVGYVVIVGVLIWLGVVTTNYVKSALLLPENIDKSFIWSAILSKLVILAALWYGLSFVIKNYNVNSHLASVNRHRSAIASTLDDFIAVEQQQEKPRLSEVLQNASDAMFKNMPIGYVSKTEKDTGNPVLQIVNDLMGVTKSN